MGYECAGWGILVRCQSIVIGLTTSSYSLNLTQIQFGLNRRTYNVAELLIFTDRNRNWQLSAVEGSFPRLQ